MNKYKNITQKPIKEIAVFSALKSSTYYPRKPDGYLYNSIPSCAINNYLERESDVERESMCFSFGWHGNII